MAGHPCHDRAVRDRVIHAWHEAAQDLRISIEAPFWLPTPTGPIRYLLRVEEFGLPKGTLIGDMNDEWRDDAQAAADNGYHFSALNPLHYEKYDREAWTRTLNDWGWCGDPGDRPEWCTNTPWSN